MPSNSHANGCASPSLESERRILAFARIVALLSALAVSFIGCQRTQSETVNITRPDAGPSAGVPDAGPTDDSFCVGAIPTGGPSQGGIESLPGVPTPVVLAPQGTPWVTVSNDPECAALKPGPVPPQLAWTAPSKTNESGNSLCWADSQGIDGEGNFAASSYPRTWFIQPSGHTTVVADAIGEDRLNVFPSRSGFLLLTDASDPFGYFFHHIAPDGTVGPARPNEGHTVGLTQNPLGGYVETRDVVTCHRQPVLVGLQIRWIDDALQPLGDWQTVMTWQSGYNNYWSVLVDQQGKALVLWFVFPQGLGAPAPPSAWRFGARWISAERPLTEEFEPVITIYTPNSRDGFVLFAGWGSILRLPEGGFAMFQYQIRPNAGGTVSPTGWYALYPSAQPLTAQVPNWLREHDGALLRLAGATTGYVGVRRDPNTCARTLEVVGPSGQTCFTLAVEGSELCDPWQETVWPDGTLLLRNICDHRWWPGIARSGR